MDPDGVTFAEPTEWFQHPIAEITDGCIEASASLAPNTGLAYGLLLDRDYETVVVQGYPLPLAVTVFDDAKAGEWVWHDENGNARFEILDSAEDAAYAIYLCGPNTAAALPATDAAPPTHPHSALVMLLAFAVTAGLLLLRRHPRVE